MWLYPEVRTLGEFIEYYARREPERLALIEGRRKISFGEYDRVANKIANGLVAKGVASGDRVAFFGLNSADFYFALIGTAKTRAAFTPLNWRLAAPEIAVILADCGAKVVLVERALEELWCKVLEASGASVETLWFDGADTLESQFAGQPAEKPTAWISEDDAAIQLYTSGTTGVPKGVVLTHGGFSRMRLCEHLEPSYEWRDGDVFINALPNFHLLSIGIAFQTLYNGVAVSIIRQFDPGLILEAIERDKPTLLTLAPAMIQMLLDHPKAASADFSSLRMTLYAGSAISLGLIKRAMAAMPCQFMQFYGATESGGALSILRPEEHDLENEEKLKSCGRPLPLIEFRIVDAAGDDVPDGEHGELVARTPAITAGYWKKPDETDAVLRNGWYRTGDVARRDADGLYYIVDRVKDMIVTGGENVYSSEVENALSVHADVSAVAVIGVPDERWGEAVKAVVILREGATVTEAALIEFCKERLAGYKTPKSIDFVDSFPLVPSGKVSKKDLRAKYWEGHGRGVA